MQQKLNNILTNYSLGPGSGAFESPGNSASNEEISKLFRRKLFQKTPDFDVLSEEPEKAATMLKERKKEWITFCPLYDHTS